MSFSMKYNTLNHKKTSLRAVGHEKRMSSSASVTVEASLALPFFIFFFVNILALFNILGMESRINAALHQTGNHISIDAFNETFVSEFTQSEQQDQKLRTGMGIFSMVFLSEQVRNYLGQESLEHSCITGGSSGITFWKSNIMLGNDYVDIVASYKVHPLIRIIGFSDFEMESRYFGHAWTGYALGDMPERNAEMDEELVYITENGAVYHTDINCTYLKLSIESVPYEEVSLLRSESGNKYYPCEICGKKGFCTMTYITNYGNRYHSSLQCPGLKRTIYTVPLSEVGGKPPCSKCGIR